MFYQPFLSALVQLSLNRGAVLRLEEREIFLRVIEGFSCEVKTLIHSFPEKIPSEFTSKLGCFKRLSWHENAATLELDFAQGQLFLVGSMPIQQGAYLSFKERIRFFLEQAKDWQETCTRLCTCLA